MSRPLKLGKNVNNFECFIFDLRANKQENRKERNKKEGRNKRIEKREKELKRNLRWSTTSVYVQSLEKKLYPGGFLKRTLVDASSMNRVEHSPAATVPYLLPN